MITAATARRPRLEVDFTKVVPGQTGILEIKDHALVHGVDLVLAGGLTPAHISKVEVKLDDQTIYDETGQYFEDVCNDYDLDNDATTTSVLSIPFQKWGLKGIGSDFTTSINMGIPSVETGVMVDKIRVYVTLTAGAPAAGTIVAYSQVGPQLQPGSKDGVAFGGPGVIPRILGFDKSGLVVGRNTMDDFLEDNNSRQKQIIRRITFGLAPGHIEEIKVMNGEQEAFRCIPSVMLKDAKAAGKKAPANRFILDPELFYPNGRWLTKGFSQFKVEAKLKDDGVTALPASMRVTAHYEGKIL